MCQSLTKKKAFLVMLRNFSIAFVVVVVVVVVLIFK